MSKPPWTDKSNMKMGHETYIFRRCECARRRCSMHRQSDVAGYAKDLGEKYMHEYPPGYIAFFDPKRLNRTDILL